MNRCTFLRICERTKKSLTNYYRSKSVPSEIDVVFVSSKCIGIKKMSMKMKRKISCFHRHCWRGVRQKVGLSPHRLRFIHTFIFLFESNDCSFKDAIERKSFLPYGVNASIRNLLTKNFRSILIASFFFQFFIEFFFVQMKKKQVARQILVAGCYSQSQPIICLAYSRIKFFSPTFCKQFILNHFLFIFFFPFWIYESLVVLNSIEMILPQKLKFWSPCLMKWKHKNQTKHKNPEYSNCIAIESKKFIASCSGATACYEPHVPWRSFGTWIGTARRNSTSNRSKRTIESQSTALFGQSGSEGTFFLLFPIFVCFLFHHFIYVQALKITVLCSALLNLTILSTIISFSLFFFSFEFIHPSKPHRVYVVRECVRVKWLKCFSLTMCYSNSASNYNNKI